MFRHFYDSLFILLKYLKVWTCVKFVFLSYELDFGNHREMLISENLFLLSLYSSEIVFHVSSVFIEA